MPKPKPLATRVALVTGAAQRHRQGDRRTGSPPRAPASSSPTSTWQRRDGRPPPSSASADVAIGVAADVTDAEAVVEARSAAAVLAFGGVDLVVNNAGLSISKPLLETTERGLGPAARRHGQGLASSSRARRPG